MIPEEDQNKPFRSSLTAPHPSPQILTPAQRLQAPMPTSCLDLRVPAPEFPEEVNNDLPLLLELPEEVEDDSSMLPAHLLPVSAVFLGVTSATLQHPSSPYGLLESHVLIRDDPMPLGLQIHACWPPSLQFQDSRPPSLQFKARRPPSLFSQLYRPASSPLTTTSHTPLSPPSTSQAPQLLYCP